MPRVLRAWAIKSMGKTSVRNLQYGPRTRLVRGIYAHFESDRCQSTFRSIQHHYLGNLLHPGLQRAHFPFRFGATFSWTPFAIFGSKMIFNV